MTLWLLLFSLLAALPVFGAEPTLKVTGSGAIKVVGSGAIRAASGSTITLVASGAAGSTNAQTVDLPSLNSTGASIGFLCTSSSGSLAMFDNKGGTFTELETQGPSIEARLIKITGATWGTGHVVSLGTGGATRTPAGAVAFFSGVTMHGAAVKIGDTGTTFQPGSVTPGAANNVAVTCLASGAAITESINNGFIIANQFDYTDPNNLGVALAYKIQTSATNVDPVWTSSATVAGRAITIVGVP